MRLIGRAIIGILSAGLILSVPGFAMAGGCRIRCQSLNYELMAENIAELIHNSSFDMTPSTLL